MENPQPEPLVVPLANVTLPHFFELPPGLPDSPMGSVDYTPYWTYRLDASDVEEP